MAAEYMGSSLNLKLDFESAKKSFVGKISSNKFQIFGKALLIFGGLLWLIVISVQLENLRGENQSIKKENEVKLENVIEELNQKLNDTKAKFEAQQKSIHTKSKKLVNSYFSSGNDISKVKEYFLEYIRDDIYAKVGDYGYFFTFEKAMNYEKGKKSCDKIRGHIVEFDETDPNIQEFFKALEKQFGLQAGFYVGLTDTETEGSFKWEKSGTYYSKMPQAMSLWKRGEPNNIGLNEHCVVVTPLNNQNKRSLNDIRCTIDHFVICQKNSY